MTLRARRIYYSLAILVFCLAAPLIIATASGWRWFGWRQGFISTGTLIVTATPKATLLVNGEMVGSTPKRLSGLTPGRYELTLVRAGYQTWNHLVTVREQTSRTVGPVHIIRSPLKLSVVNPTPQSTWLVSRDDRIIVGWTLSETGVRARRIWPTPAGRQMTVPTPPLWVAGSQQQQRLALGLDQATIIFDDATPRPVWTISAGDPVSWLSSSQSIFYRIEHDQLVAYDQLTLTRKELQSAQSLAAEDDRLWLSRRTPAGTSIELRTNTLATNASSVMTLAGEWRVVGTVPRGVFISTPDRQLTMLLSINRLTGRIQSTRLGGLTTVLPHQEQVNPLWTNGVDVVTLSEENQTNVLLRTSVPIISAAWVDPGDILALMDQRGLSIRSVSAQQGRGTLVSYAWPAGSQPLALDANGQSALVVVNGTLQQVGWQ